MCRSLVWRHTRLLWLTVRRLALLAALAKNRDKLPLVILLPRVVDLDRFLIAVGGDANDSAATYRRADRRPSRTELPLLAARLKAALLAQLRLLAKLGRLVGLRAERGICAAAILRLLKASGLKTTLRVLLGAELVLLRPKLAALLPLLSLLSGLTLLRRQNRLLSRSLLICVGLRVSEQPLRVRVLHEDLRPRQAPIGIDRNKAKVFPRDRIFVGATDESQAIRGNELIDGRRINAKPPLIFLDSTGVLLTPENQLFFHRPFRLHLVCGNAGGNQDRSGSRKKHQRSKRKSRVWPMVAHVSSGAAMSGAGCFPGLRLQRTYR